MKLKQAAPVYLYLFNLFLLSLLLFNLISPCFAQTNTTELIEAKIQLSVCGNNVAEGGEDCDNTDLNNQTCQSLDFQSGTLSCNISCDFNTSQCVPKPSPTPSPSPSPDQTQTEQDNTTESETETTTTTLVDIITQGTNSFALPLQLTNQIIETIANNLKPINEAVRAKIVQNFDANNNGRIEKNEISQIVQKWVDQWREMEERGKIGQRETENLTQTTTCDFNNDQDCDLVDFSILLYYIEE